MKRSQKLLWSIAISLLIIICVGVFAIWRNITHEDINYAPSKTQGCVDNRKQMIEDLGGPEKAAQNGVSSTLEGCDYSN